MFQLRVHPLVRHGTKLTRRPAAYLRVALAGVFLQKNGAARAAAVWIGWPDKLLNRFRVRIDIACVPLVEVISIDALELALSLAVRRRAPRHLLVDSSANSESNV